MPCETLPVIPKLSSSLSAPLPFPFDQAPCRSSPALWICTFSLQVVEKGLQRKWRWGSCSLTSVHSKSLDTTEKIDSERRKEYLEEGRRGEPTTMYVRAGLRCVNTRRGTMWSTTEHYYNSCRALAPAPAPHSPTRASTAIQWSGMWIVDCGLSHVLGPSVCNSIILGGGCPRSCHRWSLWWWGSLSQSRRGSYPTTRLRNSCTPPPLPPPLSVTEFWMAISRQRRVVLEIRWCQNDRIF